MGHKQSYFLDRYSLFNVSNLFLNALPMYTGMNFCASVTLQIVALLLADRYHLLLKRCNGNRRIWLRLPQRTARTPSSSSGTPPTARRPDGVAQGGSPPSYQRRYVSFTTERESSTWPSFLGTSHRIRRAAIGCREGRADAARGPGPPAPT